MHISNFNACTMTQVTIRRVQEAWVKKAKEEAKARGVSMNTVLVDALARGLAIDETKPVRKNNLDKFAGDSDFGPAWDRYLESLNEIDEELWK